MTTWNGKLQIMLQQPQGQAQVNGKDGVIVRVRNKCSSPSLASSAAFHYVSLRPSGDWDFQPRAQLMTTQPLHESFSNFFDVVSPGGWYFCCQPAFSTRPLNYFFFLLVLFPLTPSILTGSWACVGLIAYVYDPTRGRKWLVVYSVMHIQINYIVLKYNHYKKLYGNNLKVKDKETFYWVQMKWFHKLEWRKTWHLNQGGASPGIPYRYPVS